LSECIEAKQLTAGAERPTEAERSAALPSWVFPALLGMVMAGAFVLRIWGLKMGLPSLLHPDEWRIINPAVAFGGTWDFNPHQFDVGSGMMYLCFVLYAIYFGIGHLLGTFASVQDFGVSFFVDPTPFYLIGRSVSVAFGLAAVYMAYLIGKRLMNKWAGSGAALLVAIHPEHVSRSHFAYPDPMMVFFMLAAIYVLVSEERVKPSYRTDVLFGLLLGLGTGAKYLSIFLLPGYIAWRLWPRRQTGMLWRAGGVALGCAAFSAGLFAADPYLFIDHETARYHMFGGAHVPQPNQVQPDRVAQQVHVADRMWRHVVGPEGLGGFGALAALGGLVVMFRRRPAVVAAFGLTAATNIAYFLHNIRYMERWLFATYVWLWIMGGVGLAVALRASRLRFGQGATMVIGSVATVLVVMQPLGNALQRDAQLAAPDTRVRARNWIETNVPAGAKMIIDGPRSNGPQVNETVESLREKLRAVRGKGKPPFTYIDQYYRYRVKAAGRQSGPQYYVIRVKHRGDLPPSVDPQDLGNPVAPGYVMDGSFRKFVEQGVQYAVVNERSLEQGLKSESINARTFYRELVELCQLAQRIAPGPDESGPTILIYECMTAKPADEAPEAPDPSRPIRAKGLGAI